MGSQELIMSSIWSHFWPKKGLYVRKNAYKMRIIYAHAHVHVARRILKCAKPARASDAVGALRAPFLLAGTLALELALRATQWRVRRMAKFATRITTKGGQKAAKMASKCLKCAKSARALHFIFNPGIPRSPRTWPVKGPCFHPLGEKV